MTTVKGVMKKFEKFVNNTTDNCRKLSNSLAKASVIQKKDYEACGDVIVKLTSTLDELTEIFKQAERKLETKKYYDGERE